MINAFKKCLVLNYLQTFIIIYVNITVFKKHFLSHFQLKILKFQHYFI